MNCFVKTALTCLGIDCRVYHEVMGVVLLAVDSLGTMGLAVKSYFSGTGMF